MTKPAPPPDPRQLLSARQIADLLMIPLVKVYSEMEKGGVPCYRIGPEVWT